MKFVIYGDFNCPYSCLASARADGLLERGLAEVEWRAVEHNPSIPAPSEVAGGDVAARLRREVAEVRGLLRTAEVFPIATPPVHPNTATAVAAFADASPYDSDGLRRRLFAALWFDASTQLPLFWLTSPPAGAHELHASCAQPFAIATFGPLITTGAETPL